MHNLFLSEHNFMKIIGYKHDDFGINLKLEQIKIDLSTNKLIKFSNDFGLYASDKALLAYISLSPEQWNGFQLEDGNKIVFQNQRLAHELIAIANTTPPNNLKKLLINEAMQLDYCGILNDADFLYARIDCYNKSGSDYFLRSYVLYEIGVNFSIAMHWQEAAKAYWWAEKFDPLFAWHVNNFAWMAATSHDPEARSPELAINLAERACLISRWGCWVFLSTLAAAFARNGDFYRAVSWQTISLCLTTPDFREKERNILEMFKRNMAYSESEKKVPAAGNYSYGIINKDYSHMIKLVNDIINS
jgi:hypothetical protein